MLYLLNTHAHTQPLFSSYVCIVRRWRSMSCGRKKMECPRLWLTRHKCRFLSLLTLTYFFLLYLYLDMYICICIYIYIYNIVSMLYIMYNTIYIYVWNKMRLLYLFFSMIFYIDFFFIFRRHWHRPHSPDLFLNCTKIRLKSSSRL